MHNLPIRAFIDRIYSNEDIETLYLRARVGHTQRKAQLIHSNIQIDTDAESLVEEVLSYFEGWVYEEDDKCFLELMRARKTNPIDVVAFLPADVIDMEEEEEEVILEEGYAASVKTLTDAVVSMAADANHRASVSQQRYLGALEVMVEAQIEMAHAQARLAVEKEETPSWVTALSAISPAFGPLIGDAVQKLQDKKPEPVQAIEEAPQEEGPTEDKPPIVGTPRQSNPLEAR